MEVWKRSIAEVAQNENVFVKVGGCGMPNYGNGWHERETPIGSVELAEATAPYYLYVIEQFGVNRCMFESNFPVDKVSYSYNVMWNSFKRIVADFSDSEKAALFPRHRCEGVPEFRDRLLLLASVTRHVSAGSRCPFRRQDPARQARYRSPFRMSSPGSMNAPYAPRS